MIYMLLWRTITSALLAIHDVMHEAELMAPNRSFRPFSFSDYLKGGLFYLHGEHGTRLNPISNVYLTCFPSPKSTGPAIKGRGGIGHGGFTAL